MIELDDIRAMALALPETIEKPHFNLVGFRVRDKLFAAVTKDRGHAHVHVSAADVDETTADGRTGLEELRRGDLLLGLTVDLAMVQPDRLERLVRRAWRNKAPRKLIASLGEQ